MHTHVHFGDHTRQAALFEAMLLAAGADGQVTKHEIETIYRQVAAHPAFHGIQAGDLRKALSHAADRVTAAHDLDHLLPSLADRIPDQPSRKLAFRLAAGVATTDSATDVREIEVLKALQTVFALGDTDVAELFESAIAAHST